MILYEIRNLLEEQRRLSDKYSKILSYLRPVFIHLAKIMYIKHNFNTFNYWLKEIINWSYEAYKIIHSDKKIRKSRLINTEYPNVKKEYRNELLREEIYNFDYSQIENYFLKIVDLLFQKKDFELIKKEIESVCEAAHVK